MKVKTPVITDMFLLIAILVVLLASSGCLYPKAEKVPGSMVSDIVYEVVDDTAVVEERRLSSRWWVNVDCDYWAGCFMRCDGSEKQCRQLAQDAQFKIISVSPY
ncbi:MAG TPA: hypothetical protein DCX78_00075 [Nitrospina sp.]|jgi:hypothetical protein|nr:hypothetical protein [Nitrospinaceae bacterium]MDP7148708.1 hypothetical protein [Nitrospinaceae bacterium]HAX45212.1 hypothetical protein [Nitrospina sp.]|tara:strand:- start:1062 stop:1373 length:312 start_codon:yes stop_codon:yes gene_type:complete